MHPAASAQPPADQSLTFEHEALLQQATALSALVARRRADLAHVRAQTATLSLSLESAKEQLDNLLRSESIIRTKSPSSPDVHPKHPDFVPDRALVRSLQGQLDVTTASVQHATKRREQLRAKIKRLENAISPDQLSSVQPVAHPHPRAHADPVPLTPAPALQTDECLDDGLLNALNDAVRSNSSFRSDHVRIWRDATMPNLALLSRDANGSQPPVSMGVITERIFEGITCFTTLQSKQNSAVIADKRIETCTSVNPLSEHDAKDLMPHFAALSIGTEDAHKTHILAAKVALNRGLTLIAEQDREKSAQPLPQIPANADNTRVMSALSISQHSPKADVTSSTDSPLSRKSNNHHHISPEVLARISPRLSDSSHVLQADHFAQIIAGGVPLRFHESDLDLVYSTNCHGMSLHTLYNRVKVASPTIIAIRDTEDHVFGCYASAPWKSSTARYYGTGESFVFGSSVSDPAKLYRWTRSNSFFQFTSNTFLAIGGGTGSHFAIWIDEDLLMGTTSACATFGNPPLTNLSDTDPSSCREFKITSLEVWTFVPHVGRRH